MPRSFHGPALTEIAFVLIIAGLVLGSVLKSQERLPRPSMPAGLRPADDAVRLYSARYAALPGDDRAANRRWLGSVSGDGDGVIDGDAASCARSSASEICQVADHLRRAGLAGQFEAQLQP